ncbi:MAG: DoxX family protein [Mycobacterium sp.]|uniref:DoxX family protein n=1 Tax=Mycobacterium sp. TaxID=1785 RepID=UPI001EC460C8|nr:DoxX family protein [Mycobacterium sp.]MBW0016886.1 DoxX family protein [Mycobacterium sp.]
MFIRRIARPMLAAVFIGQGVDSLRNPKVAAQAAAPTVDGLSALPDPVGSAIPSDPQTFAQINAAVQIGGGLLLATGRLPRLASAALAFTVLPANLGAHMFWNESDPAEKARQRKDFLTDVSLLGGLVIASADTAGKPSLGWRGRRAAERLSERVSGSTDSLLDSDLGERIAHGLQVGAERGRELASTAAERSAPYAEAALERGREWASTAAEKSAPYAEAALERSRELASTAAERSAPYAEAALDRGREWASTAAEKSKPLAKKARKRGEKLASTARERGAEFADVAAARGGELAEAARERVAEAGGKPKRRWR